MMGALVEIDRSRVARCARDHNLPAEDALTRLLEKTVAAPERERRLRGWWRDRGQAGLHP